MVPVVAIVGLSGSGKTTLITQLIQTLTKRGYRIGAIKHTHHDFEIDHPGTDSFVLKTAGAAKVVLLSPHKLALISDLAGELPIEELIVRYFGDVQLVLAEGLKHTELPKILVGEADLFLEASNLLATVTARRFQSEEIEKLADLLEEKFLR
jgi:molybdopterin-guanine dinucleotide biosynthesis protein MobB